jgi:hypothetical protein
MNFGLTDARVCSLTHLVVEAFDPGQEDLGLLQLMVRLTVTVAILLGVLLAMLLVIAVIAALALSIFLGVTVTSVIAAKFNGSASKGFTWFVVQIAMITGGLIGMTAGLWHSHPLQTTLSNLSLTGLGSLVGAGVGALAGWLLARLSQMFWKKLRTSQ